MADLLADWTIQLALAFIGLTSGAAAVLAAWSRLKGRGRQARLDEDWVRRHRAKGFDRP